MRAPGSRRRHRSVAAASRGAAHVSITRCMSGSWTWDSTRRRVLAILVASAVAFTAVAILIIPSSLSPSSPPTEWTRIPERSSIAAMMLLIWLFPGSVLLQWIMYRRRATGVGAALIAGGVVAIASFATLFLFSSPSHDGLLRYGKIGVICLAFALSWFIAMDRLAPPDDTERSNRAVPYSHLSPARRAGRTAVETLVVVAAWCWTALIGSVGGMFVGADGGYHPVFSVAAPDGETRAHAVEYSTGIARGHTYTDVYLLPAGEAWSVKHRGLLVATSSRLDVTGVRWTSGHNLVVLVQADPRRPRLKYAHAYSRAGYGVEYQPDPN